MWAAKNGKTNAAQILLEYEMNVDVQNKNGETALHWAAKGGYQEVVQLLLDKQADPNVKDKNGETPSDLAYEKLAQDPENDNLKTITALLLSVTNESQFQHQEEQVSGSVSLEECLPSTSSGSRGRRKREAQECEISWEDIDKINEEKDHKRDLSKIRINSEDLISLLKDEQISEAKRTQLINLADKFPVTGRAQGLVNRLTSNQKVLNHLSRVGRVSGMTMQGMIGKNILRDLLNGNYEGVAINVGFIALPSVVKAGEAASLQGLEFAEEFALAKGLRLASVAKPLFAQSIRLSSSFFARSTSAFVVYDLVNQIKAFKNGTEEALVGVVGDSIYLGVDAAEIGVEIAEAFEVFEGVSSVTGPIGSAIGAVVFVGTDIYMAVKRVEKINEIIHLTEKERFIEGLRAFIGMQPEKYIEELMEEKQVSNQLVKQGLEYLKQHSDIKRYVFSTGKSVIDSCHTVQYREQCPVTGLKVCYEDEFGTLFMIKERAECKTKFQVDLDSKVLFDSKRADIKWSKAKPDNPNGGELFCLPKGDYEPVPNNETYLCENAIGIEKSSTGNYTLIDLGEGKDYAKGFPNSPNIFLVNRGHKEYIGGNQDDIFILQGSPITGSLSGKDGINTLDLTGFAPEAKFINARLHTGEVFLEDYSKDNSFRVSGINKLLGRKMKADLIFSACDSDIKFIDGQGGSERFVDHIKIYDKDCAYEMQIIVRPNTVIYNRALKGNFHYTVPYALGSAKIDFIYSAEILNLNNTFLFEYELADIKNINFENVNVLNKTSHTITFNFSPTFDKEFNITISGASNPSYRLNNNTEIKVGNKDNLYMLQNTNESVDKIIKDYLVVANRLKKMSFFIQSFLSNETVVIGSGNYEVIHNNPLYTSHLVGNGGENVYVIDSENKKLEVERLPIPGVVIYDVDVENSIDTIDLRNLVQQARNDTEFSSESSFELQVLRSEDDLLLRGEIKANETHEYFTIRLKNGTHRYEKTHVVVSNVPMKINFDNDKWSLKSLPLVFDQDKEIIVISPDDVERDTELVTPREAGNYIFARSRNNLIITNVFDQEEREYCTISLKDFYQNTKMQTLSIKFADKEIILKDHQEQISIARDIDVVKKEYKDQVYDNVFNRTRTEDVFFNTTSITQPLVDKVAVSNTIDEQLEGLDTEVVNGLKYLLASNGIVMDVHNCLGFDSIEDQQEFVAEYSTLYSKDKLQEILQDNQAVEALVWLIVKSYNDLSLKNPDREKHLLLKDLDQCFKVVVDRRTIVRLVRHLDEGKVVEKVERFIRNHQVELGERILHNLQEQGYILSNSTTTHQRSRRAINTKEIHVTSSNVSDDLEFFAAQNNATFVMGNDGISSAATRIGSGINDLFSWVKSSIGGLFNSRAALPENNTTQSSISQVDAQVEIDGTIMLLDLLIRKVTGQKHISTEGQSISLLEAQGYALNITTKFEQVLNETAFKSGISATNLNFNPATVQSAIVEQIRNGNFSEISKTLYSSAKEACPEFKQTDKFLARLKNNLEEVVAGKEVELLVGKQKGLSKAISNNKLVEKSVPQVKVDNKPNTFLNDTLTSKQLSYVHRVKAESSGIKAGVRVG